MQELLTELCELLSRATGVHFFAHQAINYRALGDALDRGELGLAWMPPIPAIEVEDRKAARVLVLPVRRGAVAYHTAIFTHRGGPKTIAELRGKRAAWVDRSSVGGYLVARMHLAANGLEGHAPLGSETFLGNHEAVIEAVATRRADFGATFCTLDGKGKILQAGWTDAIGKVRTPVEVIATAGPIPNDAIVVSTHVPDELRAAVLRWFLELHGRAKEVVHLLVRSDSFTSARSAHYQPLRELMALARDVARGTSSSKIKLK